MNEQQKVNFDPGFYKFSLAFPEGIPDMLEEIASLKQPHQKKFQFQRVESYIVPFIKNTAYIYLGCILWGSYLHYRHRDNPAVITGNVMKEIEIPEGQEKDFNYAADVDYALFSIEKLDKASVYYLKRPLNFDKKLKEFLRAYREFILLNGGFRQLNTTDEIKIPDSFSFFSDYTSQQLDELKDNIYKTIESGRLDGLVRLAR